MRRGAGRERRRLSERGRLQVAGRRVEVDVVGHVERLGEQLGLIRGSARCFESPVVRKNSRRAPVGSCRYRLETIFVVESAENRLRDDSMTITNLMAAGE